MLATATEILTTLLTVAGLGYTLLALWSARAYGHRCAAARLSSGAPGAVPFAPGVSILKPVKGLDPGMYEGFVTHCRQQYAGEYELLFGVSSLDDPAVAAVRRLQAEFPEHAIHLVLCPEVLGANGKASNLAQMATHARYDYLIVNDSDIAVSAHYLSRVLAPFADERGRRPVGMVTALYRGRSHGTIPSRLEALGISTDFIPGVLTALRLEGEIRFGLGSTLAVSRTALRAIGGFAPLAEYLADDYQLGERIARAGFGVELAMEIVETSVPAYSWRGFFAHQLRWARGTRDSRKLGYVGLIVSYSLAWAMLNLVASGLSLPALALLSIVLAARVSLALGVGVGILNDGAVLRDLWLLPLRDLCALGIWAWSFAGNTVEWRGQHFTLRDGKLRPTAA